MKSDAGAAKASVKRAITEINRMFFPVMVSPFRDGYIVCCKSRKKDDQRVESYLGSTGEGTGKSAGF
jgi:hypothetical protein